MNFKDLFSDLSAEELTHLEIYHRDVEKLANTGPRVLSESEISRLAVSLEKIIEEVSNRVGQQTDKVNT